MSDQRLNGKRQYRLVIRGIAIVVGSVGAFVTSVFHEEGCYLLAIIPALITLGAAVFEFTFADYIAEKKYPKDTELILRNLKDRASQYHTHLNKNLQELINSLKGCDTSKVRGTLHLITPIYSGIDGEKVDTFIQITNYTGNLSGSWRFFDISKGVIGRCLRTNTLEWVNFNNEVEYSNRMIKEFGYTEKELNDHNKESRSYLAEPLLAGKKTIGVLFLDTSEPQVFPKAVDQVVLNKYSEIISSVIITNMLVQAE